MSSDELDDEARERREEIQALFAVADSDHDGRIDFGEFRQLIAELDPDAGMDAETLQVGFREIDTDHDRRIDRAEFMAWWLER
ncbi:MAG: EF-hand domain-containing protein [Steroidobacteraceae bacterium]|nr:EF-hand domain-containing protein [Nevskiaceae bacterium]MCP5360136.1 EF-hand domain-containing protein [Nevskiaceae bacterium]MCP5471445.1 EF-hand domain-containing protein [Nevskiaceae bacterium]